MYSVKVREDFERLGNRREEASRFTQGCPSLDGNNFISGRAFIFESEDIYRLKRYKF
jgi:hypothetical protein